MIISDKTTLKTFADNKINVAQIRDFLEGLKKEYCARSRKCQSPTFSPFPTMISKCFLFKTVKTQEKGSSPYLTILSVNYPNVENFAKTKWKKEKILVKRVFSLFPLTILKKKSLKKVMGNGENAGDQHFLVFPECFPMPFTIMFSEPSLIKI